MKIRNGFVSNSSSSSFIIVGKQVKASSYKENKILLLDYIKENFNEQWCLLIKDYPNEYEEDLIYDFLDEYEDQLNIIITESHGFFIGKLISKVSDEDMYDLDTVIDPSEIKTGEKIYIFSDMS